MSQEACSGLRYPVGLGLRLFSCVFITTVVVPLSAFLMFISVSPFKALSALRSAGDKLFFGFVNFKSASWLLTSSR